MSLGGRGKGREVMKRGETIVPFTWHDVRKIERKLSDEVTSCDLEAGAEYHVSYDGQDKTSGIREFESLLRDTFGEDCLVELNIKITSVS